VLERWVIGRVLRRIEAIRSYALCAIRPADAHGDVLEDAL